MRYIITQSQFHKLIYSYLNNKFSNKDFIKEINPYVKSGGTFRINLFADNGEEKMSYFWFEPGEDDDGNPHNGVGHLHVNPEIADTLREIFSVRESKILDIISDWVSETLNVDIDETTIYPRRKKTPNY